MTTVTGIDPERDDRMIEQIAETGHESWRAAELERGARSHVSQWGEELMVPYAQLSQHAKDIGRSGVTRVLKAISDAGYEVVEGSTP